MSVVRGVALVIGVVIAAGAVTAGQGRGRGGGPPATPRAAAPVDFTGTWVAVVTEDWRYRMLTPRKGDYMSVPLTAEARKVADAWDPAAAGSCQAYGAAALMRMPTRLRISWDGDEVLKVETDAGEQTRRFYFNRTAPPPPRPALQGHSVAEWDGPGGAPAGVMIPSRPFAFGPGGGGDSLKVVTGQLSGGWLRKNGVPYSPRAALTEYYTRFTAPNADEWFVVTTVVTDPLYLTGEFITSSHFKREPDGTRWSPSPCRPLDP